MYKFENSLTDWWIPNVLCFRKIDYQSTYGHLPRNNSCISVLTAKVVSPTSVDVIRKVTPVLTKLSKVRFISIIFFIRDNFAKTGSVRQSGPAHWCHKALPQQRNSVYNFSGKEHKGDWGQQSQPPPREGRKVGSSASVAVPIQRSISKCYYYYPAPVVRPRRGRQRSTTLSHILLFSILLTDLPNPKVNPT